MTTEKIDPAVLESLNRLEGFFEKFAAAQMMPQGVHVLVAGETIARLCSLRAAELEERAREAEAAEERVAAARVALGERGVPGGGTMGLAGADASAKGLAESLRRRATAYTFLAAHVDQRARFRLSEHEVLDLHCVGAEYRLALGC